MRPLTLPDYPSESDPDDRVRSSLSSRISRHNKEALSFGPESRFTTSEASSNDSTTITDDEVEEDSATEALSESRIAKTQSDFRRQLAELESEDDMQKLYPCSLRSKFRRTLPICNERNALREYGFLAGDEGESEDGDSSQDAGDYFHELQLHDFCMYRAIDHPKGCPGQFENLHAIASDQDTGRYFFDGVLEYNNLQRHLVYVPILKVSIGNLEDQSIHTAKNAIWIQSNLGHHDNCGYMLYEPAPEYRFYWLDFLWLADFNKHVIDYLHDASETGCHISLQDFQQNFWSSIESWHGANADFVQWHQRVGHDHDFRKHLIRHSEFINNQAHSLSEEGSKYLLHHPLWYDIGVGKVSIDQKSQSKVERTVVTPNVAHAFLETFPEWGSSGHDLLEIVEVSASNALHRAQVRLRHQLPDKFQASQAENFFSIPDKGKLSKAAKLLEDAGARNKGVNLPGSELIGRAIVVRLKPKRTPSKIGRTYEPCSFDYAWVKQISKSGKYLHVVWLVLPTATICGSQNDGTHYPIGNELFLSDRCNCGTVPIRDAVASFGITMFSDHASGDDELFVQTLYREEDEIFTNPDTAELFCSCSSIRKPEQGRRVTYDGSEEPDPELTLQIPKMKNLSLFSGCGMFDYGLEQHGVLETIYAIDHDEVSIRSHKANNTSNACKYVVGSVNGCLRKFLTGQETLFEADCLSAGSPCQGFSYLNNHRNTERGQRNCSLLASTLSWIEAFLPAYVAIENVPAMDSASSKTGIGNASAQAICILVALGYQIRKLFLSGSEFGAPTSRKRLFLLASAPGFVLPSCPEVTHGAGLQKIITVKDTLEGLEPITNDTTINVRRPDHIPLHRFKPDFGRRVNLRNVVQRIPKSPSNMGLFQAVQNGLLTASQTRWFKGLSAFKRRKSSFCLRRIDPNAPYPTIVTEIHPMDAFFGGKIIHPFEDRVISEEEARLAQGIPHAFILVGKRDEQLRQMGNGVVWPVGVVLGKSLGMAWLLSIAKGDLNSRSSVSSSRLAASQNTTQIGNMLNMASAEAGKLSSITRSSASPGRQLQRELDSQVSAAESIAYSEDIVDELPLGDTISVKKVDLNELESRDRDESLSSPSPATNKQQTRFPRSENGKPPPPSRCDPQFESEEWPSGKRLRMKANGAVEYEQHWRRTRTRPATKAGNPRQNIVVVIPRRKRSASVGEANDSGGDSGSTSDIVYLGTRPAKKKRSG